MPRIRSIKPEFWTDGCNLELSDSCALFFIGLWNFCDDEGKHRLDLKQLVAELGGRWHQGKVKLFLSCLIKSGQLRLNSEATWIQVTGWSHQKIDKPKQPEVKSENLQWLSFEDSTKALDNSRTFGARIGSDRRDRIGSDSVAIDSQSSSPPPKKEEPKKVQTENDTETNRIVWEAYKEAVLNRWKVEPERNLIVNKNISDFVKRVGKHDAVEIVKFYVSHNKRLYVQNTHAFKFCLMDCDTLKIQFRMNRPITDSDMKNFEQAEYHNSQLERITRGEV